MKFTVEREHLLKPLQQVSGPLGGRPTLPILGNLLLQVADGTLSLTGTDLEMEMVARVALVQPHEPGATTVPARKFFDIRRWQGRQRKTATPGAYQHPFTFQLHGNFRAFRQTTADIYNLHPGGLGGFSILTKSEVEIEEWREKQRIARKGKTPALGMKHSDENKILFGEFGKKRWDIYGRYPAEEVVNMSFKEANKKFGISKTHYYRLRKQFKIGELE
jgi:hypothetical protein